MGATPAAAAGNEYAASDLHTSTYPHERARYEHGDAESHNRAYRNGHRDTGYANTDLRHAHHAHARHAHHDHAWHADDYAWHAHPVRDPVFDALDTDFRAVGHHPAACLAHTHRGHCATGNRYPCAANGHAYPCAADARADGHERSADAGTHQHAPAHRYPRSSNARASNACAPHLDRRAIGHEQR